MNQDPMQMLSFILGNTTKPSTKQHLQLQKINRQLIISSAMFWDSKKRTQKIKTLFLNNIGLKQFADCQDFTIQQLQNIELLSLSKNAIIHLQPISILTTLVSLNVSFNKVYDLTPISKLTKLQELYATNNQIKTIDALSSLEKLKIVQLYQNKIHNFKETFQTISCLAVLNQLDLQGNPVNNDKEFVELIMESFTNIKKLNGELTRSTNKIKQMTSSKGFMSNTSMKGFGTTSMFFNANSNASRLMADPQKTLYDFCKKKSTNSRSYQKRKEKQNILTKLQTHYQELDQDFQKEIVKNVRLKNRLYKIIQNKKFMENQKQDNSQKAQQIKLLKRKVKAMKEQLFTKDQKGDLLRKLFQIELVSSKGKEEDLIGKVNPSLLGQQKSQMQRLQNAINEIKWTKKFQADEFIVIQQNLKYIDDQNQDIDSILGNFQNTIQQIKDDIEYLS